jgi:hypothetical protein
LDRIKGTRCAHVSNKFKEHGDRTGVALSYSGFFCTATVRLLLAYALQHHIWRGWHSKAANAYMLSSACDAFNHRHTTKRPSSGKSGVSCEIIIKSYEKVRCQCDQRPRQRRSTLTPHGSPNSAITLSDIGVAYFYRERRILCNRSHSFREAV